MEKNNVPDESFGIERVVLLFFGLYTMFVCVITILWSQFLFSSMITLILCAVSCILCLRRYMDYKTRAIITTAMIELAIFLYSIQNPNFDAVLPILMTSMVVVQVYGVPETIYILFAGVSVSMGYHVLVLRSVSLESTQEWIHFIFMIINVAVMLGIIYLLLCKRKKNNEIITQVITELKVAEHRKDEFLANVSHELRTPLNTICGMSEVSLKEDNLDDIRENLYVIQVAGRNLISILSDILDYSDLCKGQVVLEEENYYISSTINDVVNTIMAKNQDKNIEIIVDCNPKLPRILFGDEKKIRRVIMNIVDNAIKFTEEGCIALEITFRKETYGINLIINVRDTGIGMTQESVEKIFTDFSQADGTTSRQQSGLGLGLSISNAMVRKMGGVITLRSTYGKGTSMRVTIPQKVIDENPVAMVKDPERINAALYFNMEKYRLVQTRDEYKRLIEHILAGLQVKSHICRNLQEIKRRGRNEVFSHIFLAYGEYTEEQEYFDELAKSVRVVVLVDDSENRKVTNPKIYKILKPFYLLPVMTILNSEDNGPVVVKPVHTERFIAPKAHVLVVDDNEMNRNVIERLLEVYQVRVTNAVSGRDALDKITTKDFDFVFMDHMMPEMDGVETFKRIREKQDNYYQRVPIIALTANAVAGAREMFLREGFADFIEKPVEVSVLERVLRRNLPDSKIVLIENDETVNNSDPVLTKAKNVPETSPEISDKEPTPVDKTESDHKEELEKTPEPADETKEKETGLEFLNTKNGMNYCGGEEIYYEILIKCHENYEKTFSQLQESFDEENWNDYVIYIHALKSTMKTIGADELSEHAKELEMAGKENRIQVIVEKHQSVMDEYRSVIQRLEQVEFLGLKSENPEDEDITSLKELTQEHCEELLQQFEDAVFNLDETVMNVILEELSHCHYQNVALASKLKNIGEKIARSDYMASMEELKKVFETIQRERRDHI